MHYVSTINSLLFFYQLVLFPSSLLISVNGLSKSEKGGFFEVLNFFGSKMSIFLIYRLLSSSIGVIMWHTAENKPNVLIVSIIIEIKWYMFCHVVKFSNYPGRFFERNWNFPLFMWYFLKGGVSFDLW